jgi:hypothetical protein
MRITRTLATQKVEDYKNSEYYAEPISFKNQEILISHVMDTNPDVSVEEVAAIAAELFPTAPEETDVYRRPQPMRKAGGYASERVGPPRQQEQTEAERKVIIETVFEHFQNRFPDLEPIFSPDGNSVRPEAKLSYMVLQRALSELKGSWTVDRILARIHELAAAGLMQKKAVPQVIERVIEVKPDEAELRRRQIEAQRKANSGDAFKGFNKAEGQKPQAPVLTEQQKAALSARNDEQNTILSEAQSRIQGFTGHSHGKTASGRAALTEIFTQGVHAGLDAKQILDSVVNKINSLAGNDSIR